MNHLKYFENQEYFQEIEKFSPVRVFHQNEKFSEDEINLIRKFIDSKSDILHLYKNPKGNDIQILDKGKKLLTIYKMDDEWYYLFTMDKKGLGLNRGFICDQIEGLIKCIGLKIL